MNIQKLWKSWRVFVSRMNEFGIPVPTIRDPKFKVGSISLTLVFISSVLVVAGIVGKWSNQFGTIDIDNALEFFYASCALYFGRQWQTKAGNKIEGSVEPAQSETPPSQ